MRVVLACALTEAPNQNKDKKNEAQRSKAQLARDVRLVRVTCVVMLTTQKLYLSVNKLCEFRASFGGLDG